MLPYLLFKGASLTWLEAIKKAIKEYRDQLEELTYPALGLDNRVLGVVRK